MAVKRVLIADDNKTMAEFVRSALEFCGYFSADIVPDGSRALSAVLGNEYSLVVLDNAMPGMTGLDVVRALAKLRRQSCPPIMLITASVHPGIVDAIKNENLPVSALIAKPFTINDFQKRLEKIPKRPVSESDQRAISEQGVVYYKDSDCLGVKVVDAKEFVGVIFRGNGTKDDLEMIKGAYSTAIGAKPAAIMANVTEVTDFDETFLGLLLIFLGTIASNNKPAHIVIGEQHPENKFYKLGVDKLFESHQSLDDFRKKFGLSV